MLMYLLSLIYENLSFRFLPLAPVSYMPISTSHINVNNTPNFVLMIPIAITKKKYLFCWMTTLWSIFIYVQCYLTLGSFVKWRNNVRNNYNVNYLHYYTDSGVVGGCLCLLKALRFEEAFSNFMFFFVTT